MRSQKKGNLKHGLYSKSVLHNTPQKHLSKSDCDSQLTRAYCGEALDFPLSLINKQFPKFRGRCKRTVAQAIRNEKAPQQIKQLQKEIFESKEKQNLLQELVPRLRIRRDTHRGKRDKEIHSNARSHIEWATKEIKIIKKTNMSKQVLIRRFQRRSDSHKKRLLQNAKLSSPLTASG